MGKCMPYRSTPTGHSRKDISFHHLCRNTKHLYLRKSIRFHPIPKSSKDATKVLLVFYFELKIQWNENWNKVMLPTVRADRQFFLFVMLPFALASTAIAAPSANDRDAARLPIEQLAPYDVGSRYGQALGAVEICQGVSTTAKVPPLNTLYAGADLKSFKTQARKIYNAWIELQHCALIDQPSECKVVVDESCAAAISEIGPSGTVLPGLVEPPH